VRESRLRIACKMCKGGSPGVTKGNVRGIDNLGPNDLFYRSSINSAAFHEFPGGI
jgi:hypothetical protein